MAAIQFLIKDDEEIQAYLNDNSNNISKIEAPITFKPHNFHYEDEDNIIKHNTTSDVFVNTFKDEIKDDDLDSEKSKTKRLFRLEPGTIRSSFFNMIILSLGSGCLSLPKYVEKVSLVMAVSVAIVIGILVWWTLSLLSIACDIRKTYACSKLLKETYGKCLARLFDFMVILYVFGILILYLVIIYTLIVETLFSLHYYKDYPTIEIFKANSVCGSLSIKCAVIYVVGLIIICPLCLIKNFSKFKMPSILGTLTLVGVIILLIVEVNSYISYYWNSVYDETNPNTHLNLVHFKKGFTKDLDFFQYCSSVYYSYIVTIGAMPIFKSLNNNAIRRVQKVIRRTVISDIFLYSIIIVVGYLTFPINTPPLIIERDKIVGGADFPMSIGRIALVLTIILKLPSSYSSVRVCLFNLIWGVTEVNSSLNNFLLTFFVLLICCSVAVLYSEITAYIKLIGGICSGMVGFVFPALLYVKTNAYPRWHWKNIASIITCFALTFIGFISAGKTIYDMIRHKE